MTGAKDGFRNIPPEKIFTPCNRRPMDGGENTTNTGR